MSGHRVTLRDGSGPYLVDDERVGTIERQMPPGGGGHYGYACVSYGGDLLSWHPSMAAALRTAREVHWR